MKSENTAIITLLLGFACGVLVGKIGTLEQSGGKTITKRDTTIVTDTVLYNMPLARDSVRTRYITRYLPVVKRDTVQTGNCDHHNGENVPPLQLTDERDSTVVEIPITQKRYEGTDYCVYVSGYETSLDSILVYSKTTTVRDSRTKSSSKWHIGITGGYGITAKGLSPYIGIGLTYSLISF